jgi:tight adherence protein C
MANLQESLGAALNNEMAVLALVFLASQAIAVIAYLTISRSVSLRRRLRDGNEATVRSTGLEGADSQTQQLIESYYESIASGDENSLRVRLVRAGFFHKNALTLYTIIRLMLAIGSFAASMFLMRSFLPDKSTMTIFLMSSFVGSLFAILPNFILDRMASGQEERYRRAFPDFMDMMIVCTDSGLSMEAAAGRVSKEFLKSHRGLGVHLSIMMLEVRAGKRLREALSSLADRLHIEEAKSLATLFKQSDELGSSLNEALRVYSEEMRQMRLLRAEEKANKLPVKLVLPLGAFLFPVTMVIVLLPVMITLLNIMMGLVPS